MEVLVPVIIVTIIIGLLFVVLRRPTVVRPPTEAGAPKANETASALKSDKVIEEIFKELKDTPDGTKRVAIMKGKNQIGWAVTRRIEQTSLSPDDLRGLAVGGNLEQVARDLLAKLEPGSLASDAPPEAKLQYPGSSLVVNSFEIKRASDSAAESRDVYKTTLATEADAAQVLAWYRDWLVGHGWQLNPSSGTGSESSQEYARASEHLRLAVADPATLAPILAVPIPAGTKTVYEVEYSNASTTPPAP
jgi:hypothetical protein